MLKGDRSFHRRWEIILSDNKTSLQKQPIYIRHFFLILVLLGLLGGFLALTVPLWRSWAENPYIGFIGSFLSSFIPSFDADKYPDGKVIADLRLHILYITGGIIAMLTLLQTDWKNQVDRRKVEADIQKNEQDAKNEAAKREQDAVKSERDHIRQVHAERRSRYTKAIEQLGDQKAPIRLGGVYTLVGLVDEWLTDKSIKEVDDRSKEGQVIVNSLCSYLRALPPTTKLSDLEKGEYPSDEAEVRIAIVKEISARINYNSNSQWSGLKYDLSNIFFFYPINFSQCIFKHPALFNDSYFAEGASFEEAVFNATTNFSGAIFRKKQTSVKVTSRAHLARQ